MELQWPLILFTTFICWSAGTFGAQALFALKGDSEKAQMPSLIASVVLMVIGGIAVFMHLQHWERIFNGFGHITSGITQELIAIVVVAIIMVVFFVMIRRNAAKIPAVLCVLAILASLVLVVVMGHSYMMESRPAWNSILQVLSLVGAALALGAGTFAVIDDMTSESAAAGNGLVAIIGTVVNAVTTIAYVVFAGTTTTQYADFGYIFNTPHPTADLATAAQFSPFADGTMALTVAAIILAVLPIIFAFMGKSKGGWKVWGSAIAVCAVVGAICLRVVFYMIGGSVVLL